MPGPLAVLDANVLYPFHLRTFLLYLAGAGLYQPLWSSEIIEELSRTLLGRGTLDEERLAHLLGEMRRFFGYAWGQGYEWRIGGLALPDPDDRHVLALALEYQAGLIVTFNLRDFPSSVLGSFEVAALGPDAFVEQLSERAGLDAIGEVAEVHRASLRLPPLSPSAYLDALRNAGLARTADRLAAHGFAER